jgi:hypothetical protein
MPHVDRSVLLRQWLLAALTAALRFETLKPVS